MYEIQDLELMIQTISEYKKCLETEGHVDNEQQRLLRMLIEKNFYDWRKVHGEW